MMMNKIEKFIVEKLVQDGKSTKLARMLMLFILLLLITVSSPALAGNEIYGFLGGALLIAAAAFLGHSQAKRSND